MPYQRLIPGIFSHFLGGRSVPFSTGDLPISRPRVGIVWGNVRGLWSCVQKPGPKAVACAVIQHQNLVSEFQPFLTVDKISRSTSLGSNFLILTMGNHMILEEIKETHAKCSEWCLAHFVDYQPAPRTLSPASAQGLLGTRVFLSASPSSRQGVYLSSNSDFQPNKPCKSVHVLSLSSWWPCKIALLCHLQFCRWGPWGAES